MRIDVVCLTKTADDVYLNLCLGTIRSLFVSESDYHFDVVLVESEDNPRPEFYQLVEEFPGNTLQILNPREKFNYNRFLNIGMTAAKGSDWIVVINNDLSFEYGWFGEMMRIHHMKPELLAFSPFEPDSHIRHFGDFGEDYLEGYQRSYHVTGWCLVLNKMVMNAMGTWDERFSYWCQDDDYAEFLRTSQIGNALVRNSIVHHLHRYEDDGPSVRLIPEEERNLMTHGAVSVFREKWANVVKPVDEPKIKFVHLLLNPDYRSDLTENLWKSRMKGQDTSVSCWRRLAHRFTHYVESYNLVNRTELPSHFCSDPSIIERSKQLKNIPPVLSYGHYGVYKSHSRAIMNEFSEDLDALVVVEGDTKFNVDPEVMISKIHDAYRFAKENGAAMVTFADVRYGVGSVASMQDTSVDYGDYKKVDHFMPAYCYLIMGSERENIMNKIRTSGWHSWDIWLYWNYDRREPLFATKEQYVFDCDVSSMADYTEK